MGLTAAVALEVAGGGLLLLALLLRYRQICRSVDRWQYTPMPTHEQL